MEYPTIGTLGAFRYEGFQSPPSVPERSEQLDHFHINPVGDVVLGMLDRRRTGAVGRHLDRDVRGTPDRPNCCTAAAP